MFPPKRLICASRYSFSNSLARLAQRQRHDVLVRLASARAAVTSPISAGSRSAVIGLSPSVAARQDQQPFDIVAQLPHIARPVVGLQHGHRVVADAARLDAGLRRDLLHEMIDQEGDVLAPLRQAAAP